MIIDIEYFLPIKSPHEPLITRVVNASIMDMHIRLGGPCSGYGHIIVRIVVNGKFYLSGALLNYVKVRLHELNTIIK